MGRGAHAPRALITMDKTHKDTLIRVSGSMYLDGKTFQLGDDVTLTLKGSIVSVSEGDNQDGTKNVKYVFKAAICQVEK